ncbi:MAG: HDOD domain-containing protein, partial [Myxococcota bacterium]
EAAAASLAAATAECVGLKPFPAVAAKAMQLVQDPNVSVPMLGECIESDAVIATRLLRGANSALYRPARPYVSIEQAIMRLGLNTVVELVVGIATMQMFDDESGVGEQVRRHSAGMAAVSRVLATEQRYPGVGTVFLASLLADMGQLLIAQSGELNYAALPESAQDTDQTHLYERAQLGYDHAVLGAHVLHEWEFPSLLCQAVALSHQPVRAFESAGELPRIVTFMRVADAVMHVIREAPEVDALEEACQTIAKSMAGQRLSLSPAVLVAMWPRFEETAHEMVSLLS